jgi:chitinase
MGYDLAGAWDAKISALGTKLRPHTDKTAVDKNILPLWFDGVNPAMVNLGIALTFLNITLVR